VWITCCLLSIVLFLPNHSIDAVTVGCACLICI
jgi:hypothetical protein